MWHVYYDSGLTGDNAANNSNYHIINVNAPSGVGSDRIYYNKVGLSDGDRMLRAAMPNCSGTNCRDPHFFDPPTNQNWDWTGVYVDHTYRHSGSGGDSPRKRCVLTGVGGLFVPARALNEMQDVWQGWKHNDSMTWTDGEQLPRGFGTTGGMGDGDIPSDVICSYAAPTTVPIDTSDKPGPGDGYPYKVGENDWYRWMWIFSDGRYISGGDVQTEHGFEFGVNRTISDYDVAAKSWGPLDTTDDTFNVSEVTQDHLYYRTVTAGGFLNPSGQTNTPDSDTTHFWWNDSVKNYVRMKDKITYEGIEEWGIKEWESRRVDVTVNDFSDAGTGFDINVTVENNCQTCDAGNFSIIALIMDMDAVTTQNSVPYLNGKTIYPDLSVAWGGTSGLGEAIQYTGNLAYGESITLTWSDVGSSSTTNEYKLWCNGGTATIN